jgi:predicted ATPase/transcriptional regulator with XRE-family HTH domain
LILSSGSTSYNNFRDPVSSLCPHFIKTDGTFGHKNCYKTCDNFLIRSRRIFMFSQQSFGYWLRLKRKSFDLTREALAELVGCSAATIRKIEAEERRPSEQIARRLAEIFKIPEEEWKNFLKFARGDWKATPIESEGRPPWHELTSPTHTNLPASSTPIIGRVREIADLRKYIFGSSSRLVTLVGPPGIGKTRLGMETARGLLSDFEDGVFFIALASLEDGAHVPSTIVQILGFVGKRNRSAIEVLMDGIRDRHMLLVLDNCEHVIEDVAHLASELLSSCSHLKILATSRESFRIQGEHLYPVPALEIPKEASSISNQTAEQYPALTLFAERAHAVRPDFFLNDENIQGIASICTQLDGMPLAIELIASRIRLMSPQALLERMSGQFVLSADGMRAVIARQKTLRNAIQWSHDFLSLNEQRFFAFISVFSGGFTLDAAESIFSELFTERTVTELVTSLFDKSLLQRTINEHGDVRFSMLFTIQEYALEQLRMSNMENDIRGRHLEHFLGFAETTEGKIHGSMQVEWLNRVEADTDNFRTALGWSVSQHKTESALRLLSALGWPWEMRCYYRESQNWLEKIKSLPDVDKYPVNYSTILNHIGRQLWTQEAYDKAYSLLNESLSLTSSSAKEDGKLCQAGALNWIGLMLMFNIKDLEQARSCLTTGLEIYKELNEPHGVALNTFHLGILESELGHYEDALQLLEKSLESFRQFGDLFFISRVSIYLGYLFQKQEQYDKALYYFEQQLRLDLELQFWDGIANGWYHLGSVYHQKGDLEQAEAYYEQCRIISREHGLTKTVPTTK